MWSVPHPIPSQVGPQTLPAPSPAFGRRPPINPRTHPTIAAHLDKTCHPIPIRAHRAPVGAESASARTRPLAVPEQIGQEEHHAREEGDDQGERQHEGQVGPEGAGDLRRLRGGGSTVSSKGFLYYWCPPAALTLAGRSVIGGVSRSRAMPTRGRRSKPSSQLTRFSSTRSGWPSANGAGLKAPTGRTGRRSRTPQ